MNAAMPLPCLTPAQQAHEEAIQAAHAELAAATDRGAMHAANDRLRGLILSRDPEVTMDLEMQRLARVGVA